MSAVTTSPPERAAVGSIALGVSWDDPKRKRVTRAVAVLLALVALPAAVAPAIAASASRLTSVIVREQGATNAPEQAVARMGGTVERRLGIINGFTAKVPADAVQSLERAPGVHSVALNRKVRLLHAVDGYDPSADAGSTWHTARITKGHELYSAPFNLSGRGVDVALIDSGVAPVKGLTAPGKVLNGPDLSFESQDDARRHLDTYGHGTHMASLIAGADEEVLENRAFGDHDYFHGMAPEARIVSVKVAPEHGATDVSQIIAAVDWVVQNRNKDGLNIRVLNLSFGTDGTKQDYRIDPLAYAVEVAWRRGIVVVAAAGNDGKSKTGLTNPAYDPFVIAVAATNHKGTQTLGDDEVPEWSSKGDGKRNPDLAAPGQSMVGLEHPATYAWKEFPGGRVNDRLFRGSGTSQAAAVISGGAALLLQQRPELTPDQVKALLVRTARPFSDKDKAKQGAGLPNFEGAARMRTPTDAAQTWGLSTGTGSLDASRGTHRVSMDGVTLEGEHDIFGNAWNGRSWSAASWDGTSWSGGNWMGVTWSGDSWSGRSWSGRSWSGSSWSGRSWSGRSWSGSSWSGVSWTGTKWSGRSWS